MFHKIMVKKVKILDIYFPAMEQNTTSMHTGVRGARWAKRRKHSEIKMTANCEEITLPSNTLTGIV